MTFFKPNKLILRFLQKNKYEKLTKKIMNNEDKIFYLPNKKNIRNRL